jgi:general L-amino acid transport system permease protein
MTACHPPNALPPPAAAPGAVSWLRRNLFSSPLNAALTLLALYLIWVTLPPLLHWALLDAHWSGHSRADCGGGGACWVFVRVRLHQFLYGFYPQGQVWRIHVAALVLVGLAAPLFLRGFPWKGRLAGLLLVTYPPLAYLLLAGGALGLAPVGTDRWGGLTLTLVLALSGMLVALPLGVLLALGRRSPMPLVRGLSIAFIELWRGVPLITVLFMSSVMLPLFLPAGMDFDKLLRALIGIALFQSAYMAEVVRGGLQAIPRGQYEAAEALGLGYWHTMGLVVLPQALVLAIPSIVNTFIALLKDTSLVLIIGLLDLLGGVQAAFADPRWLGYSVEGYLFAALVYWVLCFAMSRYSQALERRLQRAHRPEVTG